MLGKLTFEALPLYSLIAMSGALFTVFAGLAIVGVITWFGWWRVLWSEWLTSLDHKRIGIMYVTLALVMLIRGFIDAMMMRTQQAIALNSEGYLPPGHFDQIFSSHGTIMIFFMAMPFMSGLFNVVVPQQIGSRDVAFPFMNSVSLWLTMAGAGLILISLVIGKFSTAGWTGYPPYSGIEYSPDVGVDYWVWALLISGVGTTMTGINFVTTILMRRAPGMTLMRMPLFTWTVLTASIVIIFAFPALTIACGLLELDRLFGMHFFTNDMGGNMMNYINLIWIWGHPEVYILVLPAFGVFSEVIATFSSKRLYGYKSLVIATMSIGLLSATVWLHHFFTMGSSANVNFFFGVATMIIAIPTGVKVYDWIFTMYRGRVRFTSPMLWSIGFLVTFAIGGMTGVMLAIPPADYLMHNSTFLVAHFHNMIIPGVLFGFLAGYMFWFPKAIGFKLDERWGIWSFWCWTIGFYLAFMPLYVLGFMGMPRRMQHYDVAEWQPHLIIAAVGAFVILVGIIFMVVQLVVSARDWRNRRDLTGDPWDGYTLEWQTSSPPAPYNFAVIPEVRDREAFLDMKQRGVAYKRPDKYHDILLPKNSSIGLVIGGLAFVLGFSIVWHIFWLAGLCATAIFLSIVVRTYDDDTEHRLPAKEVERIENERFKLLERGLKAQTTESLGGATGSLQENPT